MEKVTERQSAENTCPACSRAPCPTPRNQLHTTEMMFGLGGDFVYKECAGCGTLLLANPPGDLSQFYPSEYYSLVSPAARVSRSRLRTFLTAAKTRAYLGEFSIPGSSLLLMTRPSLPQSLRWIRMCNKDTAARVLDVGSGRGDFLYQLFALGLRSLTGIDPHLPAAIAQEQPFPLRRQTLSDETGQYDIIMFNHSLEHMHEPDAALARARSLLSAGGMAIVRTPVAGSFAARTYREHWVQLDAPRHLTVFSAQGMKQLAERTGFELRATEFDSTAMQFWASEQYRRGIPLMAEHSHRANPGAGLFSAAELRSYAEQAAALNARSDGDQACFYLRAVQSV